MKKYTYPSVTGEASEIEVTEEWAEILAQADRDEYNNNQTETRRHVSLDEFIHDGDLVFASPDDVEHDVIHRISEQRLLTKMKKWLSEKQFDLIYSLYFLGISQQEYADMCGVDKATISIMHDRAKNNLRKFLKNG